MAPSLRRILLAILPLLGPGALAQDARPGGPPAKAASRVIVIPAREHRTDNAEAVAVSPDGRLVAAGFGGPSNGRFPLRPNGGGLALWEADTGRLVRAVGEYGDI